MTGGPVYRLRRSQLEWLELEGEVVALDTQASQYLGTNPAGTSLWAALADEGATREELIQRLIDKWQIDRQRAEADVERFLDTLSDHDLLEDDPP